MATGFTAALSTDTVSNNGEGWTSAVQGFNTQHGGSTTTTALYEDFIWGSGQQTWQVTANAGTTYSLRLYLGDSRTINGSYVMEVRAYASGTAAGAFTTVTSPSAGFVSVVLTGVVATSSGLIDVDIAPAPKAAGGNGYWVFDGVDVWDQSNPANDPGAAQQATSVIANSNAPALTQAELAPVVKEAVALWAGAGLDSQQLAALNSVTYQIANLSPEGDLGLTGLGSNVVTLDATGDGHGWSTGSTVTSGEYDLLTVVMHELGHVIGVDDVSPALRPDDLMDQTLSPGERRLPTAADVTGAVTAAPMAFAVAAADPVLDTAPAPVDTTVVATGSVAPAALAPVTVTVVEDSASAVNDAPVEADSARPESSVSRGPAAPVTVPAAPAASTAAALVATPVKAGAALGVVDVAPVLVASPSVTAPVAVGPTAAAGAAAVSPEAGSAAAPVDPVLDSMLDELLSSRLETTRTTRNELEGLILDGGAEARPRRRSMRGRSGTIRGSALLRHSKNRSCAGTT